MNDRFEIRTSQSPYEMSAWCAEKSSNIGEAISRALDIILGCDKLDSATKGMLQLQLSSALYDTSKLMAFSTGIEWTVSDARDIQCHGYEGYQRIAAKYGIIEKTDTDITLSRIESFCDELSKLIAGQRTPNRTYVHELLNRTTTKHPLVEKSARLIELVTMGDLEWKDFCRIMEADLREKDKPTS